MINLLPPQIKSDLRYARLNLVILHWLAAMALGIGGIAGVVWAGQYYIQRSTKTYAAQVATSRERLKSQKLDETQKQVSDISNSVKLTVQVLQREVLFSKMLQGIGSVMPPGASLQNLSIGKIDGGIDLQVQAVDYTTATQVQVNLQDPKNKIFSKADIVNVTCAAAAPTGNKYPCSITLRALFADNSSFLFIPQTSKKAAKS